jgi:hypothetical protein
MGVLSNYVAAVKHHLPLKMREDVGEELHSTLSDSIEAMEDATGRPLSNEEIGDLLKRRGHPLLVASAYRGDRSLVGAQLFPVYVRVLKAALMIVLAVVLADYLFGYGAAEYRDLTRLFYRIYWPVLQIFAWVTVAFHVTESWMQRTHFLQRWDPMRLPAAVDVERSDVPALVRKGLLSIAVLALLGKFLLHGANLPASLLQRAEPIAVSLGSTWLGLGQWAATGLCAGVIALTVVALAQGYWNRVVLSISVVVNLLLAVVLIGIVVDPQSVAMAVPGNEPVAHTSSVLLAVKVFIGIVAGASLYNAVRQLKWLRQPGKKDN